MSLNRVTLLGNIGKDPEFRPTSSGGRFCSFSIATSERWKDRNNQMQERTEWHRIVVFAEPLVNIIERLGRKGARIYIEGQLQSRRYTDSQNQERFMTEVIIGGFNGQLIFLDRPPEGSYSSSNNAVEDGRGYGGGSSAPASGGRPATPGRRGEYYENQQRGSDGMDSPSDHQDFSAEEDNIPF
ncbi:MAG: single-stranded DNA-binding protein [Alphaproteobacteria bacterium]|nr:single-stranded DNA-binding protein [Alphaproteobacteria bacterium]